MEVNFLELAVKDVGEGRFEDGEFEEVERKGSEEEDFEFEEEEGAGKHEA
jgi:hypothetical protein